MRKAVPRLEPSEGDLCPICHDELDDSEPLAYCRWGCGRAIHASCIASWRTRSDTCVLCGARWS